MSSGVLKLGSFMLGSFMRVETVEMAGVVPALNLPSVVAPSGFGDYGVNAGVVGLQAPFVFQSQIAHVNGGGFDRTAMAEHKDVSVVVVCVKGLTQKLGYTLHVFTVRLAAGKSDVGTYLRVQYLIEDIGVFDTQLLPRIVLAVAVELFSKCGCGCDIKFGSVFQQRLGGLQGSTGVAGIHGIEVPMFEAFSEQLGLCPALFVQRRVVMALGKTACVAVSFAVADE